MDQQISAPDRGEDGLVSSALGDFTTMYVLATGEISRSNGKQK